jgi:segregation and condensation protein A
MELKSRMLTPASNADPLTTSDGVPTVAKGDTVDPRMDLVQQLLAYKRFRDAASTLESRRSEWERRFPAGKAGTDSNALREAMIAQSGEVELDDLNLIDLASAFAKIAASVNFERLGEHEVTYDDTPIELHAEDILDRLARAASERAKNVESWEGIALQKLFEGRKRGEMIGLFLATLELVRRRAVRLRQETPGGEILIALRENEPTPAVDASSVENAAPAP